MDRRTKVPRPAKATGARCPLNDQRRAETEERWTLHNRARHGQFRRRSIRLVTTDLPVATVVSRIPDKAIDRLYLEVEAAVPMVMEDNLVKVVLRNG